MKHIIPFIILFTITCLGQSPKFEGKTNYIAGDIQSDPKLNGRIIFYGGGTTEIFSKQEYGNWQISEGFLNEVFIRFIENWQEYESECGESERCYEVYVRQGVGKTDTTYAPCGNNIDPGFTEGYKGTITKTIKNKPTFEGFMDFLAKKYGKE
jgi:hypothetical protein